ncbi:PAS domain-containing protein [Azospirillum sp. TSO22-1]|uniref:PAS domain-containing protein n=1 Tax=Azospirillum sp. TSO22-1 TaxID=716789 RepID=UPI0018EEA641|nr:PAS domain-containing protein [Azospirillum sp. TSO22-1]
MPPAAPLIVIADVEGRNVYADGAVRAYTGLSGETLKGHGWLDVLHPDDQARAAAAWAQAVACGGRYEADYRYRRHDGAYCWFHAKAICDRDASGRIRRWFIVSEEIPERGRA